MNKQRVSHTITPGFTGWEVRARFQRIRKLLYSCQTELRYVFPSNEKEQLLYDESRKHLGELLNVYMNVLQKTQY